MADEATSTDTTTSTDTVPVDTAVDDASVLGGAAVETSAADTPTAEPAAEVEDETPPTGAPEKYELAMEGLTLDGDLVTEAEPILRELNLSNDQANALLPLVPKFMGKARDGLIQQITDAGAQQRKEWLDAFVADKAIGGARREESEHLAAKGLDALGFGKDHPFRKALNETGFGNHPDLIRTFRQLGEMVSEDGSFARGNAGESALRPLHERLYPNG